MRPGTSRGTRRGAQAEAAAYWKLVGKIVRAISAGSEAEPHGGPHPQRLTTELAARADAVVTMGCGDACPIIPGKKQLRVDWDLPYPKDRPIDEVRASRDDIAGRVRALIAELDREP